MIKDLFSTIVVCSLCPADFLNFCLRLPKGYLHFSVSVFLNSYLLFYDFQPFPLIHAPQLIYFCLFFVFFLMLFGLFVYVQCEIKQRANKPISLWFRFNNKTNSNMTFHLILPLCMRFVIMTVWLSLG